MRSDASAYRSSTAGDAQPVCERAHGNPAGVAEVVGRRLRWGDKEPEEGAGDAWVTVVGVTGDVDTGATLTARATTAAVRRCLALHAVLGQDPGRPRGQVEHGAGVVGR